MGEFVEMRVRGEKVEEKTTVHKRSRVNKLSGRGILEVLAITANTTHGPSTTKVPRALTTGFGSFCSGLKVC